MMSLVFDCYASTILLVGVFPYLFEYRLETLPQFPQLPISRSNNMKKNILFLLSVTLSLAGCYSNPLYRGYSTEPLKVSGAYGALVKELTAKENGSLVQLSCFSGTPETSCTQQRNQAIAALIISSEDQCLAHRRSMYGNEATSNIILGTMTNLFAGAASVISNQKYRPVYAALALFSNSERSLANETVYKQMLVTSIDKKIIEIRETKMQRIHTSLSRPIGEYGMNEALGDVVRLHSSCSFMEGLQRALAEGTQDQTSQKILRLREALRANVIELAAITDKKSALAVGLESRIAAISAALAKDEVQ